MNKTETKQVLDALKYARRMVRASECDIAFIDANIALCEADLARVVEPVARCKYCDDTGDVHGIDGEWRGVCTACDASKKDAVLQASIDFIRELTGMEPPPIEVAPPETFQPFKTFAETVCAIFTTPQEAAAQPSQAADLRDAERYRWLRDQDDRSDAFCMYGRNGAWGECGHMEIGSELLDEVIDDAMAKAVKP